MLRNLTAIFLFLLLAPVMPAHAQMELILEDYTEVDIVKEGTNYVLMVEPIVGIRKKWRGKFKTGSTTMEYLDEVRDPVN
ncbi:MAG: hypothetical protein JSW39_25220 [Desulfobacterales bacterium]|nr:MAG: hypothetical protein JSW39_25220 [Desulfobacterales bacterium]